MLCWSWTFWKWRILQNGMSMRLKDSQAMRLVSQSKEKLQLNLKLRLPHIGSICLKTCSKLCFNRSWQTSTQVSTPNTIVNVCSRPVKAQVDQEVFSFSHTTTSSSLRPWPMESSPCIWSDFQLLESTIKRIKTVCLPKSLECIRLTLNTSRTVTSCWWRTLANLKTKKSFATSSIWKEAWLTGRSKVKLQLGTHSKTKTS